MHGLLLSKHAKPAIGALITIGLVGTWAAAPRPATADWPARLTSPAIPRATREGAVASQKFGRSALKALFGATIAYLAAVGLVRAEFNEALWPYVKQDYAEAFSAYVRHDYDDALPIFRWLARHEYPPAQTMLGYIYLHGLGGSPDYGEAVRWFTLAGEQAQSQAQFELGILYLRGLGVIEDCSEAAKWLRRSAEHGNSDAQAVLDKLCLGDTGMPQDCAAAVVRFSGAAKRMIRSIVTLERAK